MSTLLLVRSWADVRLTTERVNEFFAFRRTRNGEGNGGKVIAVWVRSRLEAGLPTWRLVDEASDSTAKGLPTTTAGVPAMGGLWIRESISLAGIWTLCWLDGPLLVSSQSLRVKRDALLQVVVNASADLGPPGLVFPVFDRDESPESVAAEVRSLKARYPGVIGSVGFHRDESRGVYCNVSESQ